MEIFRHYKYLPHVILRTYTPCLVIGNLIDSERCLGPKCISNENIRKNHLNLRKRCIVKVFGKCYMCYCWLYLKKDSNQHFVWDQLVIYMRTSSLIRLVWIPWGVHFRFMNHTYLPLNHKLMHPIHHTISNAHIS